MQTDRKTIQDFEEEFRQRAIQICSSRDFLQGMLLSSADIDNKWDFLAKDYIADAVKEFGKYPTVALSWAAYLGMAVAHRWDKNINLFNADKYEDFYGKEKFDDMDEHIVRDILGIPLSSAKAKAISDLLIDCSTEALSLIRQKAIEPGTAEAFHIFVKIVEVMFKIGAALELKRMGYSMVPLSIGSLNQN